MLYDRMHLQTMRDPSPVALENLVVLLVVPIQEQVLYVNLLHKLVLQLVFD